MRGARNGAGEFGHMPLDMDGPLCGVRPARLLGDVRVGRRHRRALSGPQCLVARHEPAGITVSEIAERAHAGEAHALEVLDVDGRLHRHAGLSMVIKAVQPARIYMSGEITDGWDIVLPAVRRVLRELSLLPEDADTEIVVVPLAEQPRLRGAAALVTSPAFAAPVVA